MEPSFRCQSCKARLVLVRGSQDGVQDRRSDPGLLAGLQDSRIDESFIVLDDRRGAGERVAGTTYCGQIYVGTVRSFSTTICWAQQRLEGGVQYMVGPTAEFEALLVYCIVALSHVLHRTVFIICNC